MAEQIPQVVPAHDTATTLAFERTRVAYERTMMAWIRTAASLITFGFSIYKFFQLEVPIATPKDRLIGPRAFAFLLVGIGLVSLLLATLENRQNMRLLGAQNAGQRRSLAGIVAALVLLLGVVALLAMIFRQ